MKQKYTPPTLTIVTCRVERGHDGSILSSPHIFNMFLFNEEVDQNQAAEYKESDWTW